MWKIWRNMLASPCIYMTRPLALDNACYYTTFYFRHACIWSLMTSYQKSMLFGLWWGKPIWYNIGLLWWNLLPSLFNTATSPQIHVQVCFMNIKDNERVKGCLWSAPWLILNCYCQIFSLCPGGKKSPISIGAHKMHWHLGQKGKLKDRYFSWNNCCERIS